MLPPSCQAQEPYLTALLAASRSRKAYYCCYIYVYLYIYIYTLQEASVTYTLHSSPVVIERRRKTLRRYDYKQYVVNSIPTYDIRSFLFNFRQLSGAEQTHIQIFVLSSVKVKYNPHFAICLSVCLSVCLGGHHHARPHPPVCPTALLDWLSAAAAVSSSRVRTW